MMWEERISKRRGDKEDKRTIEKTHFKKKENGDYLQSNQKIIKHIGTSMQNIEFSSKSNKHFCAVWRKNLIEQTFFHPCMANDGREYWQPDKAPSKGDYYHKKWHPTWRGDKAFCSFHFTYFPPEYNKCREVWVNSFLQGSHLQWFGLNFELPHWSPKLQKGFRRSLFIIWFCKNLGHSLVRDKEKGQPSLFPSPPPSKFKFKFFSSTGTCIGTEFPLKEP